jgi:hypothetical protein
MKSDIIDLFTKYNFETTAVMFDDDDGVAELLLIHSERRPADDSGRPATTHSSEADVLPYVRR